MSELDNFTQKPKCMFILNDIKFNVFHYYFEKFGIDTLLFGNIAYFEQLYNYTLHNLSNLFRTYKLLDDEESKDVFLHAIKGKITGKLSDFKFAPEQQYWLDGFLPIKNDIAIDGGSYDGGTSSDFAMQGAEVYAFEMDDKNYSKCLERAKQYNFVVENLGLSSEECTSTYVSLDSGSSRDNMNNGIGKTEVAHFIDIDTYVKRKGLPHIDYIKLDIEGAELDCLKGAAKSIVRWKPKMAISAYHKPEDLWTLSDYVHSLKADYKFAFRHYRIDVHEYWLEQKQKNLLSKFGLKFLLPSMFEMVLYCK